MGDWRMGRRAARRIGAFQAWSRAPRSGLSSTPAHCIFSLQRARPGTRRDPAALRGIIFLVADSLGACRIRAIPGTAETVFCLELRKNKGFERGTGSKKRCSGLALNAGRER